MKTLSLVMVLALGVTFGGCTADSACPAQPPVTTTHNTVKRFVRIDIPMSYFDAQGACADLHGTLARAVGSTEHRLVLAACRTGMPEAVCWTGYATPDSVIEKYQTDTLEYPVCQVWE